MSSGTPVIGTDVRGIREVIHHGQTGILCGTKPEEIRKAIISLLSDPDGAAQMGVRARDQIVKQCSLDTIVQMELDTLRSLVKS
jgi:glycosyltransferase involved in cell wall biosynthesis